MLLAVDIGNSNIVLALWDGQKWSHQWRLETHPLRSMQEYKAALNRLFGTQEIVKTDVSTAIISSVAPAATKPFFDALTDLIQPLPLVIDAGVNTGIAVETEHPERVGTDLIADAAGAYALIKNSCIVVDFGTATTVMAIEKPGAIQGVAICAGLKASKDSLVANAAQLFDIPLEAPPSVLGKNTIEAMQSGLVLGHICMVEGLIDRIKQEIGSPKVVATGGFAKMLASHTTVFDKFEPMLTLDGLRVIAERQ